MDAERIAPELRETGRKLPRPPVRTALGLSLIHI